MRSMSASLSPSSMSPSMLCSAKGPASCGSAMCESHRETSAAQGHKRRKTRTRLKTRGLVYVFSKEGVSCLKEGSNLLKEGYEVTLGYQQLLTKKEKARVTEERAKEARKVFKPVYKNNGALIKGKERTGLYIYISEYKVTENG